MSGFVHGDLGTSVATKESVGSIVWPALLNSAKLALLAFIMVVPLGIAGGVFAALREGHISDRVISIGGLSATVVPEFVWAVVVILVFALLDPDPPGHGASAARVGLLHPGRVSDPARAVPGVRAVRVHRADGPSGDD